jgi:hypothetical protein
MAIIKNIEKIEENLNLSYEEATCWLSDQIKIIGHNQQIKEIKEDQC